MISAAQDIQMVAIDRITVLNPRARNKRIFNELVRSIEHLGLKKPITVSQRAGQSGYELVCGQGRLEAHIALGQTEIAAIVVDAPHDECYVMSLVENLARRQHTPLDLMRQIGALRQRGYTSGQIAVKTDFSEEYVNAICYLLDHGEDRLLKAVDRGVVPATIAIEIARAADDDVQGALTDAYERRVLPGNQVLAIRRIIEQRRTAGKSLSPGGPDTSRNRRRVSAESLIRAYRRETQRQGLLIKRANVAQARLLFVVNALGRLFGDEHFVTLLRAEGILTLPRPLTERLAAMKGGM